MRSALQLLSATILLFVISGLVSAQSSTTALRGTVSDSKGYVLPDASVTVTNPTTGFTRNTKTGAEGVYQFLQLPPATYVLTVNVTGFSDFKQTNIELLVGTPGTINVTMQVTGGVQTVEVTGTAPLVNTQDATMGHAFGSDQISNLPFEGRDPTGILSLQAGVTFTGNSPHINSGADSRSGSVNGARSDQTNVTVDGVDNNEQLLGEAFQGALRVPLDALEEFKVTTSNSDADTGRSSGGQVSLVTKSGTNHIHGTLYEYNRPTFTTANDWFIKQSEILAGTPNEPPFLLRNTFGAAVGGAIKKDRIFYFANYEGQRKRENLPVTRVVPSTLLRQGILQYPCTQDPSCPTGGVETLTAAQVASMDPSCGGNGTCPLGPGADPAVLQIFQQYPTPNSFAVGDGLDFQGFAFSSPLPAKLDAYVAKLDYNLTPSGNHRLFLTGIMNNDSEVDRTSTDPESVTGDGGSQFPGQAPGSISHINSKSLTVGYTATLSTTLINDFRFGYISEGLGDVGQQTQQYVNFRGLDNLAAQSPTTFTHVPVYNFVDNVTKVVGKHAIQIGANLRQISNIRESNSTSFFFGQTNAYWLGPSCIANCGVSLDPGSFGFPAVDSGFDANYDFAMTALAGLVTQVTSQYNLTKTLAQIPEGNLIDRHFRNHEAEFFLQDKWQVKPNLTVTYGVRYTLLQPPFEVNGNQVAPTTSLNSWLNERAAAADAGEASEPLLSFGLSGPANNGKPYWGWDHKDIAPRFAIAYAPTGDSGLAKWLWGGAGKTSIRAGYGIYFDHFGEGITNTFDRFGSFGLTTAINNPAGIQTVDESARFSGLNTIPTNSGLGPIVEPPPTGSFPVQFPDGLNDGGYAIAWGLDDKLKTPYSHVVDFSLQRELPNNFVFEASYVGRFAHRLLQNEDLAMPTDLRDPKSGMDYFTAAQLLAKQYESGTPPTTTSVAKIPYWENMYPGAAGPASTQLGGEFGIAGTACDGSTPGGSVTATQAMYDLFCENGGNETSALEFADVPGVIPGSTTCYPACATIKGHSTPYAFYSPQFASLYAWRSIGNSAYNAGEFSLRRRMTHGLEFDINYTYSKSIDQGSSAERVNQEEGIGFSEIINTWDPRQSRGLSDFDATHQINSNWVWELPFGHGKRFGSGMNRVVNGIVGGWSVSGLFRWSSGYPFSILSPLWSTNFDDESFAVLNGTSPKTGTFTSTENGSPQPNVFKDPNEAIAQFRQAYPGESGQRNNLRGPGTFNIDTGLSKAWNITEAQSIKFTWEMFNVTNTPRFDVGSMQLEGNNQLSNNSAFGNFSSTLSNARVMEFALRYSF
jgi:hypothetical protein